MLRVGLIGYGVAGQVFHAPLIHDTEGLVLAAAATSRAAALKADYPHVDVRAPEAILTAGDIDVVVIATPNDTHLDLGLRAVAAGKSVVVDKPMAPSAAEAARLAAAARAAGVVLAPFHNRRWDDDFLTLERLAAEGVIGEITTFESRFERLRPTPTDRWRERPGPGSGVWADLGPHLVDQALRLMGAPDAVSADIAALRPGGAVDDYACVTLYFGRRRAVLKASLLSAAEAPRFLAEGAWGSAATFGLDAQEASRRGGGGKDPREVRLRLWTPDGLALSRRPLLPGDYGAFYRGFRDAVVEGRAPPVTPEDGVAALRVMDAARQSAETGRRLRLDLA